MIPQPQVLVNVTVKSKPRLESIPEIMAAVERVRQKLGPEGRVLVRYSGTQAMCRVMVEAPQEEIAQARCQEIAQVVEAILG